MKKALVGIAVPSVIAVTYSLLFVTLAPRLLENLYSNP